MNPIWGHVIGVVTVILMVTFIGIWIWAWSDRHKRSFDALARLPMNEELDELHGLAQFDGKEEK